jgi:hypothetical protein
MYTGLRHHIIVHRQTDEIHRNSKPRSGIRTSFHSLPLFAMKVSSSFLAFSMMGLVATTRVGGGTLRIGRYKHDTVTINFCLSSLQKTEELTLAGLS